MVPGKGTVILYTRVTDDKNTQVDVEAIFSFSSLDKAETFDPRWVNAQDLGAQKGSKIEGGVVPFGFLTLASQNLQEFTPVFFRIFNAPNKHVVLMCSDATSSSIKSNLYKPSFAGFLDVDLSTGKIPLRSLVSQKMSTPINDLYDEIERLKAELYATRAKNGVYIPKERFYQEESERKAMADQIEHMGVTIEAQKKQLEDLHSIYVKQVQQCSELSSKHSTTEKNLEKTKMLLAKSEEEVKKCEDALREKDIIISELKNIVSLHTASDATLNEISSVISSHGSTIEEFLASEGTAFVALFQWDELALFAREMQHGNAELVDLRESGIMISGVSDGDAEDTLAAEERLSDSVNTDKSASVHTNGTGVSVGNAEDTLAAEELLSVLIQISQLQCIQTGYVGPLMFQHCRSE